MDRVFKALADPTRRAVLHLLKQRDMHVNELLTHFTITQASLSHHLDILKKADLVIAKRKGQFIFYSLNTSVFEDTISFFYTLFDSSGK